MLGQKKKLGFAEWGKKFFAYLQAEKESNPALLESIHVLGDNGRQELALSIYNFLRPQLWEGFRKNRRQTGQQVDKNLAKVMRDLNKSARNYRRLGNLASELGRGKVLGAAAPQGFADSLEAEAMRLGQQQKLAKIAFNHKRGGNKADLASLIRLQDIMDEFARRLGSSFPAGAKEPLSAVDLADLLEAGKLALGLPENQTMTDPASIERALKRFRKHPRNGAVCVLLKEDAFKTCDKFFYGPPALPSQP